jgi:hypothetical protein
LRAQVSSLHDQYQQQAHRLQDVTVIVAEPAANCSVCGLRMRVQKTVGRSGVTLAHGSFDLRETVHVCAAGCKKEGRRVTGRSLNLAKLLLPKSVVGYDVMVHVGLERFVQHRQREEIRADLLRQHGIALSSGEISALGRRFLSYLEALHRRRAPALRAALQADGGWPLHIDATGEDGRGTLLVAFAGWRRWVLGAWKVPTERAEFILPAIHSVAVSFGAPCAIMRDLGRAMKDAADELVRSLQDPIPVLACHLHFLADIGKDLLEEGHDKLRHLFREVALLPQLRAFVRQHGRDLGESIEPGRDTVRQWLAQPDQAHRIPDGVGGITAVRGLAQWVLDYRADGADQGFPFDLPYRDLCHRCLQLCAAVKAFLRQPPADAKVKKSLDKLRQILRPVECDIPPFIMVGAALSKRAELFTELRAALRLEDRNATAGIDPARAAKALNNVQSAVKTLTASLRQRRPQRGPAKDLRQAIDLILSHLDRHGPYLWGHVIAIPQPAGAGVRLVDRTNNVLESFFHTIKHGERRRSGRKILTQDFERLPPAAALAINLTHPDYVEIVCGSLNCLADAFAQLDAGDRSCSIAAATKHQNTTIETASLSTLDRRLVRQSAMGERIIAAAHSR